MTRNPNDPNNFRLNKFERNWTFQGEEIKINIFTSYFKGQLLFPGASPELRDPLLRRLE